MAKLVEATLKKLLKQFPKNTVITHVLSKVVVLDGLYHTHLLAKDYKCLAEHIVKHGIDKKLAKGIPDVVEEIANCPGMKHYLSFATKYCSWHNRKAYPIYDSHVVRCLRAYNQEERFADFSLEGLKDYMTLIKTINSFRKHYRLDKNLTFRDLDKFFWLIGA